jgi:hypothetical protein
VQLSYIMRVTLGAVIISATSFGQVRAEESDKLTCERRRESMVTAEGIAFDAPGGGKIAHLSPGIKYVAVTSLRHTDGESWLQLSGPGGAHIGWIRASQVRRTYLGLACSIPIQELYRRPK